jgi:hypothetical protein
VTTFAGFQAALLHLTSNNCIVILRNKTMDEAFKTRTGGPSRRSILRNVVLTAGATAVGGSVLGEYRGAIAQTKAAKSMVPYQDTPHQGQSCATCLQFEPPSGCKVVEGAVSAAGWCKVYVKKPA